MDNIAKCETECEYKYKRTWRWIFATAFACIFISAAAMALLFGPQIAGCNGMPLDLLSIQYIAYGVGGGGIILALLTTLKDVPFAIKALNGEDSAESISTSRSSTTSQSTRGSISTIIADLPTIGDNETSSYSQQIEEGQSSRKSTPTESDQSEKNKDKTSDSVENIDADGNDTQKDNAVDGTDNVGEGDKNTEQKTETGNVNVNVNANRRESKTVQQNGTEVAATDLDNNSPSSSPKSARRGSMWVPAKRPTMDIQARSCPIPDRRRGSIYNDHKAWRNNLNKITQRRIQSFSPGLEQIAEIPSATNVAENNKDSPPTFDASHEEINDSDDESNPEPVVVSPPVTDRLSHNVDAGGYNDTDSESESSNDTSDEEPRWIAGTSSNATGTLRSGTL